ncbi:MAG: hypothetical protein GF404_05320 [candidate division Zixibacteria bacterium]|nr:hypothetical protein [candidate division Zixibacteria bacterium]
MEIYDAIFFSFVLILAFASVIWGLRIFRIFLIVMGLWIGFGLGLFFGEFFASNAGDMYFWGIGGALICALLAWPLQRMFVFTGMGLLVGFLVFAMVMSRGGEPENGLVAGATMFIVAGFITVLFYDYFVIVLMAMVSAYAIINVSYFPHEFQAFLELATSGERGVIAYLQKFGGYYSELIWPSLLILGLLMVYAVYLQKILPERSNEKNDRHSYDRRLVRSVTFIMAVVVVGYVFLDQITDIGMSFYFNTEWGNFYQMIDPISPDNPIAFYVHTPIINVSAVSFPLAAYISFLVIRWYQYLRINGRPTKNRYINDWILAVFTGLVILPLTQMITLFAILKFEDFDIAGRLWLGFYTTLFSAPAYVIAFKWVYLIIVFPLLLMLLLPRSLPPAKESSPEKNLNYCI